jgi:hypothetical protein
MQNATWRSLKEAPPPSEASNADPTALPPVSDSDGLPESWRSLIDPPATKEAEPPPPREAPAKTPLRSSSQPNVVRHPPPRRPFLTGRNVAAVLAVVVLAQAAIILGFWTAEPARPTSVSTVPVTITSGTIGDTVTIDGREVGVTPYRATLDASMGEIRILSLQPAPAPVPTPEPPVAEPIDTLRAAAPRSGGVKLTSPVEIQVLEGERVLGSSTEGPVVTTAGIHQLDLVNSELGYRERRRVEIKAGQIISLSITPPNGRLNVNAQPWAQIWIDGKESGETPLANVSVTAGQHEVLFRHPQFGDRIEHAMVKSGGLTRISVTLSR